MKYFFSKFQIINSKFYHHGFTLVELLISVSVFSTAVVIGVGALYSAQQINIKLQATHIIMDSINLSLETVTRNIRYGSNFYCSNNLADKATLSVGDCIYSTTDSSSGGALIVFKLVSGGTNDRIAYYIENGHLMEAISNGGTLIGTPKQISSDEVVITNLHFYVIGSQPSPGDTNQPMVTIILSGKTKSSKISQEASFVLQSSITSRN